MSVREWTTRPLTAPRSEPTATVRAEPGDAAALPELRRRLRASFDDGRLSRGADDGERLLLVVEELVSNALRHGRPPVVVTVSGSDLGWLVVVSDDGIDRSPHAAVDRDPAEGGMGLALVARIARVHGWAVEGDHKRVWARVPYGERVPSRRIQNVTERSHALYALLADSATRTAETMEGLASEAQADGRSDAARRYRSAATRARRRAGRIRAREGVSTSP